MEFRLLVDLCFAWFILCSLVLMAPAEGTILAWSCIFVVSTLKSGEISSGLECLMKTFGNNNSRLKLIIESELHKGAYAS